MNKILKEHFSMDVISSAKKIKFSTDQDTIMYMDNNCCYRIVRYMVNWQPHIDFYFNGTMELYFYPLDEEDLSHCRYVWSNAYELWINS